MSFFVIFIHQEDFIKTKKEKSKKNKKGKKGTYLTFFEIIQQTTKFQFFFSFRSQERIKKEKEDPLHMKKLYNFVYNLKKYIFFDLVKK